MRHDDIVLAALIYRRNVGADLDSIRAFAFIREAKKQTSKDDKAAWPASRRGALLFRSETAGSSRPKLID
jgi:hypothetical protein